MNLAPIIGALAGGLIAIALSIYFWIATARGGRRTQAVFFLILGGVLLVVAAGLGWQRLQPGSQQPLVATPRGPVQVRVLTALPVEPWVREAAQRFNASGPRQDGQPVEVQVIAMDGLTALGKFDRDDFGALGAKTRDQLTAAERQKLEARQPLPGRAGECGLQRTPGAGRLPDRRRISRPAYGHLAVRVGHLRQPRDRAGQKVRQGRLGHHP
jgi:hypothetical protein